MRTSFTGFVPADLAFLTSLAVHNDRGCFTANREAYDEGLKPALGDLIATLNPLLEARGLPLRGDPKKSQFRIHRDVRFSNDKRPYKTHVSATLTRAGPDGEWAKMSPGMVYIHIEPEGGTQPKFDPQTVDPLDPSTLPSAQQASQDSYAGTGAFVAAGFWLSERPNIDKVRRAMTANPTAYLAMVEALGARGLELDPGDPLKRMPKGYEDHVGGPLDPALKRTRWTVRRPLTGTEVGSPALPAAIANFIADAQPVLTFGWKALA